MDYLGSARARPCLCAALALVAALWPLAGTARAQTAAPPAPVPAAQEPPREAPANSVLSNMRLRGYGDVGFGSPLQEKLPEGGLDGSTASFQIADLHLFFTAKLSDEWSTLAELLITSDFTNESSAELDRMIIQYFPNRHLRVDIGKFNSSIGYYPNQFHRAKFYQTATGRPMMFGDEDNGGILPVHQVGITVQGEIPSGTLGLHYIAEVANGRSFNADSAEVQNFVDGNNGKSITVGLFARPDAAPGLDVGFTVYRDRLEPDAIAKVKETITAAHAAYLTPRFEFLNELAIVRHHPQSGDNATSKSFYTQISNRFGIVRPYVRYEYQDVPEHDQLFRAGHEDVAIAFGLRKAVSAGLRVDIGTFAAFKVQFDRALQHGGWANGAHTQIAFAF